MLALILLFNAYLGVVLAATLLRADGRRRENVALAVAALLDAGATGGMGALVSFGFGITSPSCAHFCTVGRILIGHPTLEFTYAFASPKGMPTKARAVSVAATLASLGLALAPSTWRWFDQWGPQAFFLPYFVATLSVLLPKALAMHRAGERGGALILAALGFRWSVEMAAYLVVRPYVPRAFPALFAFDATFAVSLSYAVVAYALLRHRSIRVRGLVAEASLYGVLGLSVAAAVAVLVDGILARIHAPMALQSALTSLALAPLAAFLALQRYGGGLEAVLRSVDPKRGETQLALENTLEATALLVDVGAVWAITRDAIESLVSGRAKLLTAVPLRRQDEDRGEPYPQLAPELAAVLETASLPLLDSTQRDRLPASASAVMSRIEATVLVPVRFGRRVFGAIALLGGELDPHAIRTMTALADNLGGKLAHAHLFELQRQLEAARPLATLGSFAAAMAHDLRTPLTSMKMNLQMLRAIPALTSEEVECADIALEELERMGRYVSEVLDYAKPIQLVRAPADLCEVIDETVRSLEPLLESRRISIAATDTSTLPRLSFDARRMRQILENLIENAAHASPSPGVIHVKTRALEDGGIAIDVIDSGSGIPAEHLARVFEPFFTTRREGTGLGLAIVEKLVAAHAGRVSVVSRLGYGSTFTVTLPGKGDEAEPARVQLLSVG